MTKRKLTIIIVSAILAAILLVVAICAIVANSKNDNSLPTAELANWQGMIKDDTLLKNVVIPGAHDAGTKGLPYVAATQDKTTEEMLKCGTRYLDLRVSYSNGDLKIYHGPCKGVALADVLSQIKQFMSEHKTECLILDFQHFEEKDVEAQEGAIRLVESVLGDLLVTNDSDKSDVEYVDSLKLGDARGKCLVVWGRETDSILSKSYVFKRNNDEGTRTEGTIHSYYTSSLNKKSSSAYIKSALPIYIEKYKAENKGLFVLQGQLTDGLLVFGPHLREATHTDNMDKYVDSLKDSSDLNIINIIMRDFVTPSKNCHILQLNVSKGVVKDDCVAAYEKMISENMK